MDPHYMDKLEKNTFKPCILTMKKKKKNVCSLPIEFGQFAKC